MFTFSIDSENRITAFDVSEADEAPEGGIQFRSEKEWEELAEGWPTARLVTVWNGIPGVAAVKKFTNRQTALARIWKVLQPQPPLKRTGLRAVRREPVSSTHAGEVPKLAQASKKDKIFALLSTQDGATLLQLTAATGWQKQSVRGFLSGALKKMSLTLLSEKNAAGERVYRLSASQF